ncbi:hypothetical protein CAPTEDRAFT_226043 [Capitella teleta]|uniref:Isoleucine--tRNA ligase, cytoplasmic n=1 Tax=Capitella teleta TaxID=283909 RepID=R7TMI2_CAPTE|nr:hypothetical protein CAPTEDRAFT_226043 [Capitella teleta]|eukprot:ELT94742.1 hypothetical protein CAPTEDRAFT_226043 [Capitella teleta]
MAEPVPESINFPNEEEKIMQLWKDLDAFQTCLKQSKSRPKYTFYDGPPFATGLPHYGHILAGTVKDVVTRWAHQSGFHVERRFGWDCHGLPVEYEIDKKLNIRGPEDVAKMGIDVYNAECRKIVMRYADEWETIIGRLGRWIDFKNDYKTLYPSFMETIWWVFKQLFDKGLVYKGCKVMPFSTACGTPLSNFESGQNYKDVQDPAVIVNFPLEEDPNVKVIAWTTTPWTLPSNLSLCVHPTLLYVKVKEQETGNVYIMMEARLAALFKQPEEYEILDKFPGSKLEGKRYLPIFDYFLHMKERGAFRILTDTYVTAESGTGVVHQAPYFGEDDFRCNLKNDIITKDMTPLCPVDLGGRFTEEVSHFKGQHVKEADKNIVKMLKEQGRLVHQSTTSHSYPFCWRSDTPLIYRAIPSWFIRVEHMTDKLMAANDKTYWVPDFVKKKRFGNWLREARDWAVSRNRYWGTPIPLWVSDDSEEIVCVGSIEELCRLAGLKELTDLHRETVDKITIPSKSGKGVLRRVPEVFDCWFESGSMPYAQNHYPFEKRKEFEDGFPGDFIAEGIDQTRGWFYTLQVLGTALFGKAPFKNLICHGLVLAADGQKMSKRKQNYPNPMDVVHKYGADAIRLYLINSPVVRAENLRFKEDGVKDVVKDVFLPWYNAFRFLMQNADRLIKEENWQLDYNESAVSTPENYMDRWILSFTQSLIKYVKEEMGAYRLYTVVPRLVRFVEQLTNWYVRMNRRRLKGTSGRDDCHAALTTLFGVLFSMVKVMAPFIPFLTEHMYQRLRHLLDPRSTEGQDVGSVHYLMLPAYREDLIDENIEVAVSRMQAVIDLGRVIRDRKTMPMKYPLPEIVVIHKDDAVLNDVCSLSDYIREELNVKKVTTSSDKQKYGVHLRAEPDHKILGTRLQREFKAVTAAIKQLSDADLTQFQKSGQIKVNGHDLGAEDLRLIHAFDGEGGKYEAHSDSDILVLLDVTPDESMVEEGLAREVINRVQKLRKKAKITPTDEITVYYKASGVLQKIIPKLSEFIYATLKQPLVEGTQYAAGSKVIIKEKAKIKTDELDLTIVEGHTTKASTPTSSNGIGPACRFVNVELCGTSPQLGAKGTQGTVLLENPRGDFPISFPDLIRQVQVIFGLQSTKIGLFRTKEKKNELSADVDVFSLHAQQLFAFTK